MKKYRYSVFATIRRVCDVCENKGPTVLMRVRQPYKAEFCVCHTCLIEVLERNTGMNDKPCVICNNIPQFSKKAIESPTKAMMVNPDDNAILGQLDGLTESQRLMVAATNITSGALKQCQT